MKFKEKYGREADKGLPKNKDKNIISDDAFAVGEMIENLINKIEHVRMSLQ